MRKLFPSFGWTEIGLLLFIIAATWTILILPMLSIDAYYTWLLLQQPFMLFPIGLTIAAVLIIITIYVQNIRDSFKRSLEAYYKMRVEASKEAFKVALSNTDRTKGEQ